MAMHMHALRLAALCFGLLAAVAPLRAQETGDTSDYRQSGWVAQCVAPGRSAPADCVLEQKLLIAKSGDLVAAVKIRVPAEPRTPAMMVQLPKGLFLPAGVALRVDDGEALKLDLQTCDDNGCYAGLAVSEDLLGALRSGASLHLGVRSLDKKNFDIILSLQGFTVGYRKIE